MSVSWLRGLLPVLWMVGCAGKAQDSTGVGNPGLSQTEQALYDDGDDSRRASDVASALMTVPHLALSDPKQLDTPDGAAAVGEFGRLAFTPKECVTTARAANVVTFTFSDCTYLLGYAKVNGTLEATYAAGPSAGTATIKVLSKKPFTLEAYNRDLQPVIIDVSIDAEAKVQFVTSGKRVDWNGTYTATGPSFTLTHKPAYTSTKVTTDTESCVTLDGNASTTIDARTVTTDVSNYRRCGPSKACPEAGGKVTFTGGSGFVTIEFLGGRHTRVTLPDRSFETDRILKCSG